MSDNDFRKHFSFGGGDNNVFASLRDDNLSVSSGLSGMWDKNSFNGSLTAGATFGDAGGYSSVGAHHSFDFPSSTHSLGVGANVFKPLSLSADFTTNSKGSSRMGVGTGLGFSKAGAGIGVSLTRLLSNIFFGSGAESRTVSAYMHAP